MTFLSDHDIEGQSALLWGELAADGWLALMELERVTFAMVGLPPRASDRAVWRFAQARQMILVTANRNMKGSGSLEQTLQEENNLTSLPVLTFSDKDRVIERDYRLRCARKVVEIVMDLDNHLGRGRIYIP